jgi:hypothetical protein
MIQDTYMEHLVKKDPTIADQLKKCAILFVALLVVAACAVFALSQYVNVLAVGLAVAVCWVAVLLLRQQRVEYEYIITNHEMDIDKIMGKSKRKRLVTVAFDTFSSFEPLDPEKPVDTAGKTKILAAQNLKSTATYVANLEHKELGSCVLYFTPNEEMIAHINHCRKFKRPAVYGMGK